jgi:hypothetical protein
MTTVEEFFIGQDRAQQLFETLRSAVETMGTTELRVTRSQIAFYRRKAFAWVWMPGKYLRGKSAPLVLTLVFRAKNTSPRWKETVEPAPGRLTHHLELYTIHDIDDEVRAWLREAWLAAG